MLRLPPFTLRRTTAAIAMTAAAVLIPTIALASSGSPAAPGAAAARCRTGSLTDWIGVPGDGTAGSVYYMLEISNTSGRDVHVVRLPRRLGGERRRAPAGPRGRALLRLE